MFVRNVALLHHDRVHYENFLNNKKTISFFENWKKKFLFCWFFFDWWIRRNESICRSMSRKMRIMNSTKPLMDWWNRIRSMPLRAENEMDFDQCPKRQKTIKKLMLSLVRFLMSLIKYVILILRRTNSKCKCKQKWYFLLSKGRHLCYLTNLRKEFFSQR